MLKPMARPRTHDHRVRRRLLEAASAAVAAGGPAALSLRSTAEEAATTTAAIYSLFGSREALIAAVVEEGFRRFGAHLAQIEASEEPAEDLLALGVAYRANALQNPHFYRVMFSPATGGLAADSGEDTFRVLVAAVARAAGCDQAQARLRARRVWAYVHGLVSLELAGLVPGPSDADEAQASYVAALRAAASLVTEGV